MLPTRPVNFPASPLAIASRTEPFHHEFVAMQLNGVIGHLPIPRPAGKHRSRAILNLHCRRFAFSSEPDPAPRPFLPVTPLTTRVTGGTYARLPDRHFPSCCANLLSACGHLIAPAPRLLNLLEPGLITRDGCGAGRIIVFVRRREARSLRLQ